MDGLDADTPKSHELSDVMVPTKKLSLVDW